MSHVIYIAPAARGKSASGRPTAVANPGEFLPPLPELSATGNARLQRAEGVRTCEGSNWWHANPLPPTPGQLVAVLAVGDDGE